MGPAGGNIDKLGQETLETRSPAHSVEFMLRQQSEDMKVEVLEHSRDYQKDHFSFMKESAYTGHSIAKSKQLSSFPFSRYSFEFR